MSHSCAIFLMTANSTLTMISRDAWYLAFRAAFLTTFEQLSAERDGDDAAATAGFLDHIPLLSGCAAQVQIDCLLKTWHQLCHHPSRPLRPIEQCVCYCAVNELARLGQIENRRLLAVAAAGPTPLKNPDYLWLASKIRALQVTWPFRVRTPNVMDDGRLLNADLDDPHHQPVSAETRRVLLDTVGAWQVSAEILSNSEGLLCRDEVRTLGVFLQKNPRLMNL
ncbi:hypothetical protein [Fuerstiella marisgermanici]|nr:hypothetical protein [Fuerstiella marisgermanici]